MGTFQGYQLIQPSDLHWRPANLMKILNADYLERSGSENMSAALALAARKREHVA